jgi:hypothetical protein
MLLHGSLKTYILNGNSTLRKKSIPEFTGCFDDHGCCPGDAPRIARWGILVQGFTRTTVSWMVLWGKNLHHISQLVAKAIDVCGYDQVTKHSFS